MDAFVLIGNTMGEQWWTLGRLFSIDSWWCNKLVVPALLV
jgi:hypothetical protein